MSSMQKKALSPKQELFCQLITNDEECFGNAVQSYAQAYGFDLSDPKAYEVCGTAGPRLFRNVQIKLRINVLLDLQVDDVIVDRELSSVILQDEERHAKVAAIREYNKLKQRIVDKSETTVILPQPILGGATKHGIPSNNSDTEANETP